MTMRAFEFQACIEPGKTLKVPAEVAAEVPEEQPVRVILLLPDSDEDREWGRLAAERFLQGYPDSDAIYDELPTR
jgi:hypothetical protein